MSSKKQSDLLSERHVAYISKYTTASKDDISLLLNELTLDRPDGKMCKDAFRKWLTTMDIKPSEKPNMSTDEIQNNFFRSFDGEGKGFMEFQEFVTVVCLMTNGQEKPENIFDLFDVDSDGEPTMQELGSVWQQIFKSKKEFDAVFGKRDTDNNGSVSKDEFVEFYPKLMEQAA